MNLALGVALYVLLCKALGLPLCSPSMLTTWYSIVDYTDVDLLVEATLQAATSSVGENEAFDVNNGDTRRRHELWPRIAQWFELEHTPPIRLSFHRLFNDYRAVWCELAGERLVKAGILCLSDDQSVGFIFGWQYDMFGDGSKLRRADFQRMRAADEVFFSLFSQLGTARVIP